MPLLDRFRNKKHASSEASAEKYASPLGTSEQEAPKKRAAKKAAPKTTAADGETQIRPATSGSPLADRLLRKPHVSEKAARLAEQGVYIFEVPIRAEKVAIRQAVERLYSVKVTSVRTVRIAGKPVYRGRRAGRRSDLKKALVTLAKGQTINLYEGV